jgi:hypothetical protein
VPTGEYDLTAKVDLSPVFGVLEHKQKIRLTQPGADVLEKRLAALDSDDAKVRRTAIYDLRYFPKEGAKVVPKLIEIVKSGDKTLVPAALSVLGAYQKEALEHIDLLVSIMSGDGSASERMGAAYLVGRIAKKDPKIEQALVDGVESTEGTLKQRFEYALSTYRRRHKVAAGGS